MPVAKRYRGAGASFDGEKKKSGKRRATEQGLCVFCLWFLRWGTVQGGVQGGSAVGDSLVYSTSDIVIAYSPPTLPYDISLSENGSHCETFHYCLSAPLTLCNIMARVPLPSSSSSFDGG
jgi:hypothetical protein